MRKNLASLLLVITALVGCVCGAKGSSLMPDETLENALAYRGPRVEAFRSSQPKDCPYFLFTRDGIGYLKTFALSLVKDERTHKAPAKIIDGAFPDDWWLRPSFLKPDNGWTKITQEEAQRLWGASKERYASGWHFLTFDVHSDYNGESNIYHVDLQFDPNGMTTAYRIRGIGISNAKWMTASTR